MQANTLRARRILRNPGVAGGARFASGHMGGGFVRTPIYGGGGSEYPIPCSPSQPCPSPQVCGDDGFCGTKFTAGEPAGNQSVAPMLRAPGGGPTPLYCQWVDDDRTPGVQGKCCSDEPPDPDGSWACSLTGEYRWKPAGPKGSGSARRGGTFTAARQENPACGDTWWEYGLPKYAGIGAPMTPEIWTGIVSPPPNLQVDWASAETRYKKITVNIILGVPYCETYAFQVRVNAKNQNGDWYQCLWQRGVNTGWGDEEGWQPGACGLIQQGPYIPGISSVPKGIGFTGTLPPQGSRRRGVLGNPGLGDTWWVNEISWGAANVIAGNAAALTIDWASAKTRYQKKIDCDFALEAVVSAKDGGGNWYQCRAQAADYVPFAECKSEWFYTGCGQISQGGGVPGISRQPKGIGLTGTLAPQGAPQPPQTPQQMCFSKCMFDGGDSQKCKEFCNTITGPGTPLPGGDFGCEQQTGNHFVCHGLGLKAECNLLLGYCWVEDERTGERTRFRLPRGARPDAIRSMVEAEIRRIASRRRGVLSNPRRYPTHDTMIQVSNINVAPLQIATRPRPSGSSPPWSQLDFAISCGWNAAKNGYCCVSGNPDDPKNWHCKYKSEGEDPATLMAEVQRESRRRASNPNGLPPPPGPSWVAFNPRLAYGFLQNFGKYLKIQSQVQSAQGPQVWLAAVNGALWIQVGPGTVCPVGKQVAWTGGTISSGIVSLCVPKPGPTVGVQQQQMPGETVTHCYFDVNGNQYCKQIAVAKNPAWKPGQALDPFRDYPIDPFALSSMCFDVMTGRLVAPGNRRMHGKAVKALSYSTAPDGTKQATVFGPGLAQPLLLPTCKGYPGLGIVADGHVRPY